MQKITQHSFLIEFSSEAWGIDKSKKLARQSREMVWWLSCISTKTSTNQIGYKWNSVEDHSIRQFSHVFDDGDDIYGFINCLYEIYGVWLDMWTFEFGPFWRVLRKVNDRWEIIDSLNFSDKRFQQLKFNQLKVSFLVQTIKSPKQFTIICESKNQKLFH